MDRPRRTYRPMPAEAFNQTVLLCPATYPLSVQGGANPADSGQFSRAASVQPLRNSASETKAGMAGEMPQSNTYFEVLLGYSDDEIVKSLQIGDTIIWGDRRLSVMAPANDSGGLGVVWRIPCSLVAN